MFTGIIEDIGTVRGFEKGGSSGKITVGTSLDLGAVNIGDSMAVDGACLTVTALAADSFTAGVSPETLRLTTLGEKRPGSRVNLEPALTLGKPLGGHLVTGHVDCVGTVASMKESGGGGGFIELAVSVPREVAGQLVKKGSVTVDGISLTVATLSEEGFTVAVIPHTLESTTLGSMKAGSRVNIETDLIGKYVEKFLRKTSGGVTEDLLAEHGFFRGGGFGEGG